MRPREAGTLTDAVELLEHDHRMVEQLFRDYQAAGSAVQRRGCVEILVRELSKHAALEELLIYPFAEKVLDGEAQVREQLDEHMAVKRSLLALDKLSEDDEREKGLIAELQGEVEQHVKEEEGTFFPALRSATDEQALQELGAQLEAGKKTAPTRPHPNAPEQPPALALAAPVAAIYDRLGDRLQGRPQT